MNKELEVLEREIAVAERNLEEAERKAAPYVEDVRGCREVLAARNADLRKLLASLSQPSRRQQ